MEELYVRRKKSAVDLEPTSAEHVTLGLDGGYSTDSIALHLSSNFHGPWSQPSERYS